MFHDLTNLFYPKICNCCDTQLLKAEKVICTACLHQLPTTNYHLDNENTTKKVFDARLSLENATSLLYFRKKGLVQKLIHNLKYRKQEDVGYFLGNWLGDQLASHPGFSNVDCVLPVPLHHKKLKKRGFNQVAAFSKVLANKLNAKYIDDVLVKKSGSRTQTLKKRLGRWGVIDATFMIENQKKLENKHLLLVDDLVTTGATLEACGNKLLQIKNTKLSIATMAITD
ncbi:MULTISPECIES: ComF family protein [Salegentibacter]|uniref:ComF family protein n=1 Tax=Salegentibacter maritimus TaxID=2794347 RepID=A0ABS0TH62_9FLAO|nr:MULTISPECIES: phosphoribosyltransferase family protein [Salegentibacter]MBE7640834.1 ComF family protein [Salegentibacter sp. BLCTC]MBI6117216.1 ComF family protein [Salegentibacter maritimus]MBI6119364.1 ComF family protein [Salegentibacter maritimus]